MNSTLKQSLANIIGEQEIVIPTTKEGELLLEYNNGFITHDKDDGQEVDCCQIAPEITEKVRPGVVIDYLLRRNHFEVWKHADYGCECVTEYLHELLVEKSDEVDFQSMLDFVVWDNMEPCDAIRFLQGTFQKLEDKSKVDIVQFFLLSGLNHEHLGEHLRSHYLAMHLLMQMNMEPELLMLDSGVAIPEEKPRHRNTVMTPMDIAGLITPMLSYLQKRVS